MIVVSLDLENYKQYSGSHRIEFPEHGLIAITGPNGAGKTTLFEAIEWCLYCPRSIPRDSVPPHGGVGRTSVQVTIQDMSDGVRYVVQRELRGSGTQAEVYREDQPEQPLVQGTREVSRYVARHLIGLPYSAFVSTFFTKQKELQFFGDLRATERRIEVGRLLGLEAVREAQREIGDGRTAARTASDSLRGEYTRRLEDRDLEAEMDRLVQALAAANEHEITSEQCAAAAASEAELLWVNLERLRDIQTQDAALDHTLAELDGAVATALARRSAADAELARLKQRADERVPLAKVADDGERLQAVVTTFEEERERARELQALQAARQGAVEKIAGVAQQLRRLVEAHQEAAAGLIGWTWSDSDAAEPAEGAARLHAIARSLDLDAARVHVEQMLHAHQCCDATGEIEVTLAFQRNLLETLGKERAVLLGPGEPSQAIDKTKASIREARETQQGAQQQRAAERASREKNERIAAELRLNAGSATCPTCSRALGPEEAERLARDLDTLAGRALESEALLDDAVRSAAERIAAAEQEEVTARTRQERLILLEGRLADGTRVTAETEARYGELVTARKTALDAAGLAGPPGPESIADARRAVDRTQQMAAQAGLLEQLGNDVLATRSAVITAERNMRDIGEIGYDHAAHQVAVEALRSARRAAAQVEQIDIELALENRYQEQRAIETRQLAEIDSRQEQIKQHRRELGFDANTLQRVRDAEAAARAATHEAREAHATARQAVRDAGIAHERAVAEQTHLQRLIDDADRKAREADELQRMYDEFGEFDQYVARHIGPLLSETTERMLERVTDRKYDHVQFDENYGIEVFDGDEAFPLVSFSGGERDVVALCARLALSEIVGAAATRPPRFLVLDEVFGSLDSERRARLLGALGALARVGHFQQMFIISHIDDVQLSPVMDEAWTIEERDGVSHVVRPETFTFARP